MVDNTIHIPEPSENGFWSNHRPWVDEIDLVRQERWGFFWIIDIYRYSPDSVSPMTWTDTNCDEYRVLITMDTDGGSVPPIFAGSPSLSRTRFIGPYIFHDCSCRNAGIWIRRAGEKDFTFCTLNRLQCDQLLYRWILAWGGNKAQGGLIYSGVRIGAKFMDFPTRPGKSSRVVFRPDVKTPCKLVVN